MTEVLGLNRKRVTTSAPERRCNFISNPRRNWQRQRLRRKRSLFQSNWDPVIADLEKYTGRYFSDELETFYIVAGGEEGLVIKHRGLEDIELSPKVEDSFNANFPITEVEFMRGDNGTVTTMMVSNIRTRNVRFEML